MPDRRLLSASVDGGERRYASVVTQRVRAAELREAIADALYPVKAHRLPRVCERYGLAAGDVDEAMGSKRWYVLHRIEEWETPRLVALATRDSDGLRRPHHDGASWPP